jgi:hypothetical protein
LESASAQRSPASGRHDQVQAVVAEVRQVNPDLRADQLDECRRIPPAELSVEEENLHRAGLP